MPPRRRKQKKNITVQPKRNIALTNDDDVFELDDDRQKKVFRPYRAASARKVANSRLDDTKKHVDKKQKMSSNISVNKNLPDGIFLSDDSDFELDIDANRKRAAASKDDTPTSPEAKRKKLNIADEIIDGNDSTTLNESNDILDLNLFGQTADIDFELDIPDVQFEEEIHTEIEVQAQPNGKKTTDLAVELTQTENDANVDDQNNATAKAKAKNNAKSDLESEAEMEVETEKQSQPKGGATPQSEVRVDDETKGDDEVNVEEAKNAEVENETENVIEFEDEVENVTEANADAESDVENRSDSPNASQEQENADDDVLSIFNDHEEDMFEDEDDVMKSPAVRPKKTLDMALPSWKQSNIEKDKKSEQKRPELNNFERKKPELKKTVFISKAVASTSNGIVATTSSVNNRLADGSKVVFKIPKQPSATVTSVTIPNATVSKTPSRDPRLSKGTPQNNAAHPVINVSSPAVNQILTPNATANDGKSQAPASVQRLSIKERLGSRIRLNQPQNRLNIQNVASVTIRNGPLNAATSTFLANRINQPIPGIQIPSSSMQVAPQPPSPQQQANTPLNLLSPHEVAALDLNVNRRNVFTLSLPSFATGTQRYEPAFTYLFSKTCHYFMMDSCQNANECQREHRLPDHDFFRQSLDKMTQTNVIDLYENYMCRNIKIFKFYFEDLCTYFGKNGLKKWLKQMVEDCVERKVQNHIPQIVDGLMLTGQSFTKSLAEMIASVSCRKMRTSKEIIELILSPRNENIRPFIGVIDSIGRQDNFAFSLKWIQRLLIIHREMKVPELSDIIWHLINVNQKTISRLDPDLLTNFMDSYGLSVIAQTQET